MRKIIAATLPFALFAMALTSCGCGSNEEDIKELTLEIDDDNICVGESTQITAIYGDDNVTSSCTFTVPVGSSVSCDKTGKVTGNGAGTSTITVTLKKITEVTKTIDVTVTNHNYGELTPAVEPTRDSDGHIAYYHCSECGKYFDENKSEVEEIAIHNSILDVAIEEKSYSLPNLSLDDMVVVDIKINTAGSEFSFFLGDGWDNYIGRFEVSLNANGTYALQDNRSDGVSYNMTEDGYFRMIIDYKKVNIGQNIRSMNKYNIINMDCLSTGIACTGKIMINPIKSIGGDITRGYKLKSSEYTYLINGSYSHSLDEILTIDVKFIGSIDFNFCLNDGWAETRYLTLTTDGTLKEQNQGVQVFSVNDAVGFVGGYYRIIINLKYVNFYAKTTNLTKVDRITVNSNGCEAYVDVDSIYGLPYNPYYTIAGGDTNKKINLHNLNYVDIQDGNGKYYLDKAIVINVKAIGGSKTSDLSNPDVKFSIMDPNWHNCGDIKLIFDNGKITERMLQGEGCGGKNPGGETEPLNYWPTYTNNDDGTATLYIEIKKLNGNGWDKAKEVGFIYGDPGISAKTVSSFSIDLNFQLIDVGDIPS
ncbi:MAG: Ig-like domain-containing protein [Bacilli bacterium]|nr:Ig-like domain-containing protein [Bacilli bacterium]